MPSIRFLVVLGFSETIAIFSPTITLRRVDFPTFGLPIIEIKPERKFSSVCTSCSILAFHCLFMVDLIFLWDFLRLFPILRDFRQYIYESDLIHLRCGLCDRNNCVARIYQPHQSCFLLCILTNHVDIMIKYSNNFPNCRGGSCTRPFLPGLGNRKGCPYNYYPMYMI